VLLVRRFGDFFINTLDRLSSRGQKDDMKMALVIEFGSLKLEKPLKNRGVTIKTANLLQQVIIK